MTGKTLWLALTFLFTACAAVNENGLSQTSKLHHLACSQIANSGSPWNISNLYDCEKGELFVPYQLWTGSEWHGNKDGLCMHKADTLFHVNGVSATTIKGPRQWKNPNTGVIETIWARDKVDGSKSQYFVCHEKGIGRVYDSRRPRYYATGRCKFPAGYGWKVGERRYCKDTSIEIIGVEVDEDNDLEGLRFKWWFGTTLDHIYRYVPGTGMTHAWKQPRD